MDNLPQHTSGVFLLRPMVGFYSGVDRPRSSVIFSESMRLLQSSTPSLAIGNQIPMQYELKMSA